MNNCSVHTAHGAQETWRTGNPIMYCNDNENVYILHTLIKYF